MIKFEVDSGNAEISSQYILHQMFPTFNILFYLSLFSLVNSSKCLATTMKASKSSLRPTYLSLEVISCNNISNCTESRDEYWRRRMPEYQLALYIRFNHKLNTKKSTLNEETKTSHSHEELNQPWTNTCFNDGLNFVVCTIRKVRKCPACIC